MNNKDITDRFIGQTVTVVMKKWGEEKLLEETGRVESFEPRKYLNFLEQEIEGLQIGGHIAFCGLGNAIHIIKDKEGKILYRNDSVLEAYKRSYVEEEKTRQELREKGVFYLE
jgi:hypothetical protein